MITKEPNYQRKSHRVDLHLYVEFNGRTYPATDWSTTGVGLTGLEETPELGAAFPVKLIFPMVESALTLTAQLMFRAKRGDTFGFEFHEMSARNKRVLRHYIELAVEGKLGNLEDMVALSSSPDIQSPIDQALNLTELESEGMLKRFKRNSYLSIALGMLLLIVVSGLLFYNTVYKIEATGIVSGNTVRITANMAGTVHSILVKQDAYVEVNTPLFSIEDQRLRGEIDAIEQQIKNLTNEHGQAVTGSARVNAQMDLLASLKNESEQAKTEFDNARNLYQQNIISNKDLALAENRYRQKRSDYLREFTKSTASGANKPADMLNALKADLAARKLLREQQVSAQTILTDHKGKVFLIDKSLGEFVSPHEAVMLLETDVTPTILVRLLNDDVLKLHVGMPAVIYTPFEGKQYEAVVSAFGHAAVNAEATKTMESSLNETVVRLSFLDKTVRLPTNSRVKVWIKTFGSVAAQ